MAGGMGMADLVADLKTSLHDSAAVFKAPADADFQRFLRAALADMGTKRPVTRKASVTLEADTARYAVPVADFAAYKTDMWADAARLPKPWEAAWPGPVPRVAATWDGAAWWLDFEHAPSAKHLAVFGRLFQFWYFGLHVVGDNAADTTVTAADRGLLLLRAQVEAMRELSIRAATKPVQLRDGLSGVARNSTPAALHEVLLRVFWEAR